ncbi:single-stranded DNA-binding protein [Flavobacterium olei]|uniref:single-stranded DNA-binding protein n=1 Tax=Flavobacterium olei TaxID=1886782 RepID=UPI0032194123
MEITGRVTADAVVRKAGEKEVVNFSIAVNDRYKSKDSTEYKEVTVFINCSYWLSVKSAEYIKKGAVVQVSGRIGMHVYINNEGNPVGSLDFHVNAVSIIAFAKRSDDTESREDVNSDKPNGRNAVGKSKGKVSDDVPF